MLLPECFPQADKSWEDLNKGKTDWAAWKNLYKASDRKTKVKKQAVAGQDQIGAAHGALRKAPQVQRAIRLTRSAADLDEYFDALAASATTKKGVLEESVKANAALTTTRAELLASVASFIKANKQLSCWVGNHRNINNRSCKDSPAPHPKTLCPHCNIKVMHAPDNCFEL